MASESYYIEVSKDGNVQFNTVSTLNPGSTRATYAQLSGRLKMDAGYTLRVIKTVCVDHDVTADFLRTRG